MYSFLDPQNFNIIQDLSKQLPINHKYNTQINSLGNTLIVVTKNRINVDPRNKRKKYYQNHEKGNYFIIGLINSNNVNNQLNNAKQGKLFCNNSYQSYGIKILKGEAFQQIYENFEIELRVDILNRYIQVLDYPNYQNQNQLNQGFEINNSKPYYLGIYFGSMESFYNFHRFNILLRN
ncbi:hypothetical protein ABPG74_020873 [Tetrahymena malaccensis]